MNQNKTTKYFKYAIGEIVLVVIGILIALQINNWNEDRKDGIKEQQLLTQLLSEFQSNLNQLDQKINLRKDMIQASFKLLDYIDNPEKIEEDSILRHLIVTQIAPTFDPIVNDITSSGRIQVLKNQELKEKLSLWTSEIIQVTEEEDAWLHYRSNEFVPYMQRTIGTRTLHNQFWQNNTLNSFHLDDDFKSDFKVGNSKHRIDFNALLNDKTFESYISQCASFSQLTNSQSYSLRQRIVEIIDLINQALNND